MRLNEFLDYKATRLPILNEAGPAFLAVPLGAAAMEAMALYLGFAGAAALAYDISQNPDRYNRAMRSAGSAYIAVSDWLRDTPATPPGARDDSNAENIPDDLVRNLETQTQQAIDTQPAEVQQRVSAATQDIIDQVDNDADAAADMVSQWAAQARASADAGADAAQAAKTAPAADDEAPTVARAAGEPAVATSTPAMAAPAADDEAPGISKTTDDPVSRRAAPDLVEPTATGNDLPDIDTTIPGIGKDVDLGIDVPEPARDRERDAAAAAGAVSGGKDVDISPPVAGAPPNIGIIDLPVTGADAGVIAAPAARAISRAATATPLGPRRPGGTGMKPRRGFGLPNLDARFDLGKFSPIQIADPLDLQRSKRFQ